MAQTPESRLKKAIKVYLKSVGAYHTVVPGGSYGTNGAPDMIACYKGRFIAIEAKTPEGTQSGWQKLRQNQIEASDGIYILARSVEDVEKVIRTL